MIFLNLILTKKGSRQPSLLYDGEPFDASTCSCSFGYLVQSVEILVEFHMILHSGGAVNQGFLNSCFGTKTTIVWRATEILNHVKLINACFQYSG